MSINDLLPPLPPQPLQTPSITDDAFSAFTSDCCSICLCNAQFQGREVTIADLYQTQCGHLFHTDCLSKSVSERCITEFEDDDDDDIEDDDDDDIDIDIEDDVKANCPLCRDMINSERAKELYCYGKALSLNTKLLALDENKELTPDTVKQLLRHYPTAPYPNRLIANLLLTALKSEPPQEDHVIEGWLKLLKPIKDLDQQEAEQIRSATKTKLLIALDQLKPDQALKWLAICPINDLDNPAEIIARIITQLQDAVVNNLPELVLEYLAICPLAELEAHDDTVNIKSDITTQLLKTVDSDKPDIVIKWLGFFPIERFNEQDAIKIRNKIITQAKKKLENNQHEQAWGWARLLTQHDYLVFKNDISPSVSRYVLQALSSNRPDLVSQWFTKFPLETFNKQDQWLIKGEINRQLQYSANQNLLTQARGWISLNGYMNPASLDEALVRSAQANQQDLVEFWIDQGANTGNPAYWQAQLENAVNANQPNRAEECINYGANPSNRLLSAGLGKSANDNQPGLAEKWLLLGASKNTDILDKGLTEAVHRNAYQDVYQWLVIGATKTTDILNKGVEEEIRTKNYSKIGKWLAMGADKDMDILKNTIKNIPYELQMLWLKNGVQPEVDFLQKLMDESVINNTPNRVIPLLKYILPSPEIIEKAIRESGSTGLKRKHQSDTWQSIQKKMERIKKKARIDQH